MRARYVVGADGACSTVRRLIGEDLVGETYAEDWLIVDALGAEDFVFDHVEFVCDPDRPTPHMVAPGGRARWEFMLKPGETREEMESDAKIAELLRPWVRARISASSARPSTDSTRARAGDSARAVCSSRATPRTSRRRSRDRVSSRACATR